MVSRSVVDEVVPAIRGTPKRGHRGRSHGPKRGRRRSRTTLPGTLPRWGDGADPQASRRRGPGENSTGLTAVARRFRHTPGGYCIGAARQLRSASADCLARTFDTPQEAVISSARRRTRRRAPVALARSCAFRGRMSTRGPAERIAHSPDEADLSAQEAAPRQGAWLPRPDEDARRPARHRRPTGPWSKATDGLTNEGGPHPPRLVMLSRPQEFAALQAGTVRSHPLLTVRFLRTDLETTRFGLATGRKLGGAVVRNRVRRRLREGLRALAPSFQPGWDVLIIARPAIVETDYRNQLAALRRILQRGGVVGGQASS